MTPTNISTSATEMPRRMDTRLAMSAIAIQAAAMNQMFSMSAILLSHANHPGAGGQEPSGS